MKNKLFLTASDLQPTFNITPSPGPRTTVKGLEDLSRHACRHSSLDLKVFIRAKEGSRAPKLPSNKQSRKMLGDLSAVLQGKSTSLPFSVRDSQYQYTDKKQPNSTSKGKETLPKSMEHRDVSDWPFLPDVKTNFSDFIFCHR